MPSAESFVNEAIPHEAGHIVVGMLVGVPIRGLALHIVRTDQGTGIGDFATQSVEPPDEEIPNIPATVLKSYELFIAGGLAGNNFAFIPATAESLQNDRVKLARVGTASLEEAAKEAVKLIDKHRQIFRRLRTVIEERFLLLMADPTGQTGWHVLLTTQHLEEIRNGR
jgi:hypothetical protein